MMVCARGRASQKNEASRFVRQGAWPTTQSTSTIWLRVRHTRCDGCRPRGPSWRAGEPAGWMRPIMPLSVTVARPCTPAEATRTNVGRTTAPMTDALPVRPLRHRPQDGQTLRRDLHTMPAQEHGVIDRCPHRWALLAHSRKDSSTGNSIDSIVSSAPTQSLRSAAQRRGQTSRHGPKQACVTVSTSTARSAQRLASRGRQDDAGSALPRPGGSQYAAHDEQQKRRADRRSGCVA